MKILLQDLTNSLYVKRCGKRTADPTKALIFPHTLAAVRYQHSHPMETLQIVLHWAGSEESSATPVAAGSSHQQSH